MVLRRSMIARHVITAGGQLVLARKLWAGRSLGVHLGGRRRNCTGGRIPEIASFTNCRDYVRAVVVRGRLDDAEWATVLSQIVDTLPAGPVGTSSSSSALGGDNGGSVVATDGKAARPHHHYFRTIKSSFKHSFVFGVCQEMKASKAALSLLDHMSRGSGSSDRRPTPIHCALALGCLYNKSSSGRVVDNLDPDEVAKAKELCRIVLDTPSMAPESQALALAVLVDLSTKDSEILSALSRWNSLSSSLQRASSGITNLDLGRPLLKASKALALNSLRRKRPSGTTLKGDLDEFWGFLNHDSFVPAHPYLRELLPGQVATDDPVQAAYDEVFHSYLSALARSEPSTASRMLLEFLQYFSKNFVLATPKVEAALNDLMATAANPWRSGSVGKSSSLSKTCQVCGEAVVTPGITGDDARLLKDYILDKVLVKDDLYQSTNPKELDKFVSRMDNDYRFRGDISDSLVVVDGLNIALLRTPLKKFHTVYDQSKKILSVLHILKKLKKEVLMIHRPILKSYPDFGAIRKLCNMIILDNLTQDDPYILLAALSGGPDVQIFTNDMLRQHNYALGTFDLRAKFTTWQMKNQIRGYITSSKMAGHKSDTMLPRLQFPKSVVIKAVQTPSQQNWHLPLPVFETPNEFGPQKMNPPLQHLCLRLPSPA